MRVLLYLAVALHVSAAWGSDACSERAIETRADVSVSDGSGFRTESYFHSADAAAIRHIRENEQIVAVEGPLGWARVGDRSQAGADFHKVFALGHQYHAFLLYFEEIVTNIEGISDFEFKGKTYRALSGDYPYGGTVTVVNGAKRPVGFVFDFPDTPPITAMLDDWRTVGDEELPFLVSIDDGERVFDYRYTRVNVGEQSPLWFFEATGDSGIDEVEVYRLHRTLLAAHCLGDFDLLADRSTENITSANNGRLATSYRDETRERFKSVFERWEYTEYHDIEQPAIEVAESGDLGWIGVNVRAVGADKASGDSFDSQWAWIMIVRKIDGRWYHAGNASNMLRQ